MELDDFNYDLPKELIAQKAASPKDHSKLMIVNKKKIEHKHFYNILDYLNKDDVLVINETRVSKAKIAGKKITGSKIELILTKKIDNTHYECWIKANRVDIGNEYVFEKGLKCKLIGVKKDIFIVEFNKKIRKNLVDEIFELPLPPYVKRKIDDEREYQTVYSKKQGSLAAPTAGLHFTDDLLKKIKKKGVKIAKICLHIDFGTFLTIKGNIEEHKMHEEYFEITKQAADIINNRKARLIVVGTTSVRALEASSKNGKILAKKAKTDIFIYPGYEFKNKIDALITNFHLPKSTLLMLVSAYYGMDSILKAYKEAVKKKYRFYSLGDAMLLIK